MALKSIQPTNMSNNDTHTDIRDSAPTLYALAGKTGFQVPEGYFDLLPRALTALVAEHEDNGAPEGYFDALKADILAQTIGEAPQDQRRIIPFKKWGIWAASVAAMVAVALTLLPATPAECQTFACLFEELSDQDLFDLMDEEDLIDLLEPSEGADMGNSSVTEDLLLDEVSLDALLDEWDSEDLPETW